MIIYLFITWFLRTTFLVEGGTMSPQFRFFCTGPYLDFPFGLPANQRVVKEQCQQLVPSYSEDASRRQALCKRYAPFTVISAEPVTSPRQMIKCTWTAVSCPPGSESFMNKCLQRTPSMKFSELKSYCQKVHRVGNRLEGMWLIKLFSPGAMNIWVANDPKYSQTFLPRDKTMGYSRSNYDYGMNYVQASIIGCPDFEVGASMGMLIPTDDEERLIGLCVATSTSHPLPPVASANITFVDYVTHIPITSETTAFVGEVFTFDGIQEKSFILDVSKIYTHCKKLYSKGFPLTPTPDVLSKLKGARDHPVFILGYLSKTVDNINDCKAQSDPKELAKLYKTHDGNMLETSIDPSLWEPGFPKPRCSKHASVALIVNRRGRLENFPSSARLPVVCGTGKNPLVTEKSKCSNINAVEQPDGTCKCNNQTQDINDIHLVEGRYYERGQFCVRSNACKENTRPLYLYFVVDESESINFVPDENLNIHFAHNNWGEYIVPFVNKVIDKILPSYAKGGGVIRFGKKVYPTFPNGWDAAALKAAMATPYRRELATNIDLALQSLLNHLDTMTFVPDSRIVTVLLTDAKESQNPDEIVTLANKIKAKGDSRIIVYNVGNAYSGDFSFRIASRPTDVLQVSQFSYIDTYLTIMEDMICPAVTVANFTGEP